MTISLKGVCHSAARGQNCHQPPLASPCAHRAQGRRLATPQPNHRVPGVRVGTKQKGKGWSAWGTTYLGDPRIHPPENPSTSLSSTGCGEDERLRGRVVQSECGLERVKVEHP